MQQTKEMDLQSKRRKWIYVVNEGNGFMQCIPVRQLLYWNGIPVRQLPFSCQICTNFHHLVCLLIFSLHYRNVNPLRMRQSLGSNSPLVTRVSYQFPTYGLAVVVKNKFLPLEASPLVVGICFSPRLLNHGVGNWYEPLVTRGELLFLSLAASRS